MLKNTFTINQEQVEDADCITSAENFELVYRLMQQNFALEARNAKVRKRVTTEEFAQLLVRIANAETEKELGDIRHDNAENYILEESMYTPFSSAIEERRVFLNDKNFICSDQISPYDRAQYIARNMYSTVLRTQQIVNYAIAYQAELTKNLTPEEIMHKTDFLASYRSNHKPAKIKPAKNKPECDSTLKLRND